MAKVLLVDANQDNRVALSKALADAGYDVAVAPSGSSAVSALEWERPDLVVSYAKVQDMDGYELFTLVRKDATTMDTPFLLLAGRDRPIALAAAEAGADMTLTGDFTFEVIVGRVGEFLKPATRADAARPAGPARVTAERKPSEPLWAAMETAGPGRPGAAFQGSLEVMDLAEVTQAIALGGKTGSLVVSLAAGDGEILFENGRVIHAGFRGRTGEEAFSAIVSASQGEAGARFAFSRMERAELPPALRTISRSVEQLLLSIAVGIDEGEPSAGSFQGVSSARRANG